MRFVASAFSFPSFFFWCVPSAGVSQGGNVSRVGRMSSVPSWYGVEVADLYKRYILECWVHLHGKKKKRLLKYGQGDGAPGSTMKRENNSRGTNDNSDNQDSDDHDKGDRAQHIWKFIRCFWK